MMQYDVNKLELSGCVQEGPAYSHDVYEESFYRFTLASKRLSGVMDILPVMVSDRLIQGIDLSPGSPILLHGQVRSYNKMVDGVSRLYVMAFARGITPDTSLQEDVNQVVLEGCLCKQPIYRITPFQREIADLLLAVNRLHGKSDYIPCIAWGHNARLCENLSIGQRIEIIGRIQSRQYIKRFESQEQTRTALEVSLSRLGICSSAADMRQPLDISQ